ncbi:hypothetical protein V8C42DRAFT_326616 [Trichoderma barbatum]
MTKRVRSDRRPYGIRPASLIQVKSQSALDNLSRYEQVSRQFAQEFPQIAWGLGQRLWIPCVLSPHTGRQDNTMTAPTNDATAADSSIFCGSDYDSEFATSVGYDIPMYDDDYFDALPITMTPTTMSPIEQPGNSDAFTPPDPDADYVSSCSLEALTSQLLWYNQVQESCYNHTMQYRNEGQMEEQCDGPWPMDSESLTTQPVEQREPSDFGNRDLAEASSVDRDRMNQIMIDLNQLGSRLREDARRQLDVISDEFVSAEGLAVF